MYLLKMFGTSLEAQNQTASQYDHNNHGVEIGRLCQPTPGRRPTALWVPYGRPTFCRALQTRATTRREGMNHPVGLAPLDPFPDSLQVVAPVSLWGF